MSGSIKGEIERSSNRTFEESKTTSREVEIRGGSRPIKLVWIESFITGKCVAIVNNKEYKIPFEFRADWDLQSRKVDD